MEKDYVIRTLEYEDLLICYDLLKKIVKKHYPNSIACFIEELENPWGWSALAKISIVVRNAKGDASTFGACITYSGDVATFCDETRKVMNEWLTHVKTREERFSSRELLIKPELIMKTPLDMMSVDCAF
jgi:hypothetical protein